MAEDDKLDTSRTGEHVLTDLGNEDIQTNVYEGGLKSWECSLDLAKLLLQDPAWQQNQEPQGLTHIGEVCSSSVTALTHRLTLCS
jgi:protein-histidine N-methyltransferase